MLVYCTDHFGSVRVPLNSAWSASFFIQNSIFLSQYFIRNSIFHPNSSKILPSQIQNSVISIHSEKGTVWTSSVQETPVLNRWHPFIGSSLLISEKLHSYYWTINFCMACKTVAEETTKWLCFNTLRSESLYQIMAKLTHHPSQKRKKQTNKQKTHHAPHKFSFLLLSS